MGTTVTGGFQPTDPDDNELDESADSETGATRTFAEASLGTEHPRPTPVNAESDAVAAGVPARNDESNEGGAGADHGGTEREATPERHTVTTDIAESDTDLVGDHGPSPAPDGDHDRRALRQGAPGVRVAPIDVAATTANPALTAPTPAVDALLKAPQIDSATPLESSTTADPATPDPTTSDPTTPDPTTPDPATFGRAAPETPAPGQAGPAPETPAPETPARQGAAPHGPGSTESAQDLTSSAESGDTSGPPQGAANTASSAPAVMPQEPPATSEATSRPSRVRWIRRIAVSIIVLTLIAVGGFFGVWWKAKHDAKGLVSPGVALNGEDIGGLTRAQVLERAREIDDLLAERAIIVEGPTNQIEVTYAQLGLAVDSEAIADEAMSERPVDDPRTWWQARSDPIELSVPLSVDPIQAVAPLEDIEVPDQIDPVEPTLRFEGTQAQTTPGSDGFGIRSSDLLKQLPTALSAKEPHITLTPNTLEPTLTEEQLIAQADKIYRSRGKGVNVTVGGETQFIDVDTLIDWVRSEQTPNGVVLTIDSTEMAHDLSSTFTKVGTYGSATFAPDEATGELLVTSTESGVRCCGEIDSQVVFDHLARGDRSPIELPTIPWDPASGQAELRARGMDVVTGEFTTFHPAGASRVTNIHRIADIVNGAIIEPGETFSVNDYVGRRTVEKGFVDAGVIVDGRHESDVGGGVSQFATTLFNAAFFGGLDITEYQSHSLYISRYPYGREATLWYPYVDLKLHNQTATPVLITTSYTDSSLTVRLFSIPSMVSDQTGQTKSRGRCTTVRTERTRTPLDGGAPIVDYFTSTYRPAEGVSC